MKRLFALVLLFCLSLNTFAATGTIQELSSAFDEYQYALTVEWDQQDKSFQEAQTKAFFQKISLLMSEGLTQEKVLAMAEAKMANKEALAALKAKLTVLNRFESPEQLAKFLSQNSKMFYAQGASWNGSVDPMTALLVVGIAAIIGYAIWFTATHECVAYDQRWECSSDTYYDDYGSYTDTSCGWESYCTRWVKKD